jgi:phospholipase/carboxylesterase
MTTSVESQLTTFEDWTLRLRPAAGRDGKVFLMLHGWTGDENSMWAFARDLPVSDWLLAPRAPFATASGYSWRARHEGWPTYEDLRPSAARLIDLLERWGIANGVDATEVDLIGFSQGAAMCVTFALAYPARVRRMAILAGFAPPGCEQFIGSRPLEGKRVFAAHGTRDQAVKVEYAQRSVQLLEACGARVSYCESDTGHKVGADCRRMLADFFSG